MIGHGTARHRFRQRGLGANVPANALSPVTPWYCGIPFISSIQTPLNIPLSGSSAAQAQMNATCYPNIAPPVPEVGPQTPQQMTGAADWTPDMAIQATSALQNQQNSGFFMNFGTGITASDVPSPGGGGGGGTPSNSLCSLMFGNTIAGQIGQALCPVVLIVGGVALVALLSFIFIEKR
jgi:hypothetical protein